MSSLHLARPEDLEKLLPLVAAFHASWASNNLIRPAGLRSCRC